MAAPLLLLLAALFLIVSSQAPPPSPPTCTCPPAATNSAHASGFYPVTRNSNTNPPSFMVAVTFGANNEHDPDEEFTPLPPWPVNLTLDSSCNQIILPWRDCFQLRLQDACFDRAIQCNATAATCGANPGQPVYPTQAQIMLLMNGSSSYSGSFPGGPSPSPSPLPTTPSDNVVPILCSSGSLATAGIAPYRLSLVVQMHSKLQALNLPKVFGYCLGKPKGYFFVGQPNYVFSRFNNTPVLANMQDVPTLRWDQDVLPVLSLRGLAVHGGDEFGTATAPLDESVFQGGLEIGTGHRYLTLVSPAYNWLRSTMMSMANSSSLERAPLSPFQGLDLCYTLQPNMSLDDGGPQLELRFGGNKSWLLNANSFLEVSDDKKTVCLGAVSVGATGVSSLGTLQQEESVVEYNFEHQSVSVSQFLPSTGTRCGQLSYPA